jgi:hypothetical protein
VVIDVGENAMGKLTATAVKAAKAAGVNFH